MATFEDVYLAEQRRAFKLAYLLCGEAALAEDVVADVVVAVWPRWQAGEIADVGAYLRRAVVNQVTSRFRRRSLERRQAVTPGSGRGPEEVAVDRLVVRGALLRLPPRQRAAIVLRYYEDLSEADIAAAMATSVGTTKAHLSRGLATLRVLLDDQEGR